MKRTTKPKEKYRRGPTEPITDLVPFEIERGRPAKLTEDMPHRIYVMAAMGLTIAQMAESSGLGVSTLDKWLAEKPEIREAYEKGKWEFDFGMEYTLKRRAEGYEYWEEKEYSGYDSLGREWSRTVRTLKRVEPDVTALIFWLKNRSGHRWRDVYNGPNTVNNNYTQVNNLNMEMFDENEQELMRSMAIKKLANRNGTAGR